MSTAALSRTLDTIKTFVADNTAAYQELIVALADDREVDAGEVLATVEAAGHTLDDLAAAVDRLVSRRLAAALLAEVPVRTADLAALNAKLDRTTRTADAEFAQVRRECEARLKAAKTNRDEQVAAVEGDRDAASEALSEAESAAITLRSTASASLTRRLVELRQQRADAIAARDKETPGIRQRIAYVDGLLKGGVPELRDETRRPYGGSPLNAERERRDEARAREVRVKQVALLTRERETLVERLESLAWAPASFDSAIAQVERDMLVV